MSERRQQPRRCEDRARDDPHRRRNPRRDDRDGRRRAEEGDSDGTDAAAATATRTATTAPTRTARTAIPTAATRAAARFARCVAPVEAERFFGEYWERKPLLVPRDEEGRFLDLLSIAEVERRVTAGGLRHPAFRVVKEGATIGLGDYAEDIPWTPTSFSGSARVERVAEQFERGATIVLQALQLQHPPLADFCRELERELGHPVQANAYYTPLERAGLQGAPRHARRLRACRSKARSAGSSTRPSSSCRSKSQKYSPELGEPGEPVLDVTMRAGDTLYLPRGWLHQAMTSDAASLHLTVGRQRRPPGATRSRPRSTRRRKRTSRSGEASPRTASSGRAPRARSPRGSRPRRSRARQRRAFVEGRRPIREDAFDQLRALEDLDVGTQLERQRDRDRRPRRRRPRRDALLRGRDAALPGARRAPSSSTCAAAEEPFRPPTCPGGSTRRAGSCSSAASCARVSCGSGWSDDEARAGASSASELQVSRVRSPGSASTRTSWVSPPAAKRHVARRRPPLDPLEREVVDPDQARRLADRALGRLHRRTGRWTARGSARAAMRPARCSSSDRPARLAVDPPVVEPSGRQTRLPANRSPPMCVDLPDPVGRRARRAAPRRAAGRSARSTGRACRACRRGRAGGRAGLPARRSMPAQVLVRLELGPRRRSLDPVARRPRTRASSGPASAIRAAGRRGAGRAGPSAPGRAGAA